MGHRIVIIADRTRETLSGTERFLTTLGRELFTMSILICSLHEGLTHHYRGRVSCGVMFGYSEDFRLFTDVEKLIDKILRDW